MNMNPLKKFMQNFTLSQPVAIILAGVIIGAAIVASNLYTASTRVLAESDAADGESVSVPAPSADDHIIGSPDAKVVLIEYLDFQCPYCQMIQESLEKIVTESNGEVAWVMRNLPLTTIHPEAQPAAEAAECVAEQKGNEGYWQFTKQLLANQQSLGEAYYAQLALGLGLNMESYQSCVSTHKYQAKIEAEAADAASNGAQGTPYTVVYGNGKQRAIPGALPYASIKGVVNLVKGQ